MAETKSTTKKPATKTSTKSSAKTTTKNTTRTATKSSTASNNTATKSSTSKSTKRSSGTGLWGLNKTSFWCIGAMAILYLVASILSLCGLSLKIILALQGLATALAICLVACLAWRYVKNKQTVWKVLYVVLLLVVILGIVIPLVK